MDIVERHFAAENAHDVAATLDTYTDDVIWDDVANPACPVRGKFLGIDGGGAPVRRLEPSRR